MLINKLTLKLVHCSLPRTLSKQVTEALRQNPHADIDALSSFIDKVSAQRVTSILVLFAMCERILDGLPRSIELADAYPNFELIHHVLPADAYAMNK